jgi:hypothetical protein
MGPSNAHVSYDTNQRLRACDAVPSYTARNFGDVAACNDPVYTGSTAAYTGSPSYTGILAYSKNTAVFTGSTADTVVSTQVSHPSYTAGKNDFNDESGDNLLNLYPPFIRGCRSTDSTPIFAGN